MLVIPVHPYLMSGQVRDYPEYLMRDWIARFSKSPEDDQPGTRIVFRNRYMHDMIVVETPEQIHDLILAEDQFSNADQCPLCGTKQSGSQEPNVVEIDTDSLLDDHLID